MRYKYLPIIVIAGGLALSSCKKDDDTDNSYTEAPAIYQKLYGASNVYVDGDEVVITSTAVPDHKSPYFLDTQWESSMYEAYNGTNSNFVLNPNRIATSSLTFRIPLYPAEASNKESTPMGAMGISLNGIPFFNQYAAGGTDLGAEIDSFDQYNGHPQQTGQYHYHMEPLYLTATQGNNVLLGFLLDGFPVYGTYENGEAITNNDLDSYHGHFSATADYPDGIYHYHITAQDPYINGDGFYGTPGTVSQ